MNDVISRSALEKIVRQSFEDAGLHYADGQKFLRWLRKAPALDAVPVVRCKDCWKRYGYQCPMYVEEESYYDATDDDGFCHQGARMDGETDD